jgi:hypothetical protein
MANNPQIKFFKVASMPTTGLVTGAIYFDTTLGDINIATGATTYDRYGHGFREVEFNEKVLTFTKSNGQTIQIDFSDVASAKALSELNAEVAKKLNAADQVVKSVDTTANAGVALVKDAEGKLSVSVAEGDVAENNEAVVLGGQVYAAIDAAKTELAGQISGKNVDAEGDAYVNATAADNKVTVAATQDLIDAVGLANSAVQDVTILGHKLENGDELTVDQAKTALGLGSAAYENTTAFDAAGTGAAEATAVKKEILGYTEDEEIPATDAQTIKGINDRIDSVAGDAKSYSIAAVTGDELAGLGANVKEAYKLVDEDSAKAGEYIKIYKDSALQSVVLNENQELVFTYLLADGSESVVPVSVASFLAESEFGNGLSVNSETGVVSVKVDAASESFLTVGADGVKLAGVQDAIDTAVAGAVEDITEVTDGIDERVKELEATKETVASALQADDIATGGANGTIAVKGADVAVKGLGSAAYTEASAYATAAQGALADSAVQSVVAGSTNGTIAVDGTEVAVTGLKSAAFVETTAFDAAGAAAAAEAAAISTIKGDVETLDTLGKVEDAINTINTTLTWAEFN